MKARKLTLSVVATVLGMAVSALASAPALATREYVQTHTFGEPCSGSPCGKGQFSAPSGVAVNASDEPLVQPFAGDVYVIDTANARVERFSASGAYLGQFNGAGSYETGGKVESGPATPAGSLELSSVGDSNGIAVDSSSESLDPSLGDVYVADDGHKVVDKFSGAGRYEGQLTGTCPKPGTCTAAEVIPFSGSLNGIAVDPAGNVWVYEGSEADEFTAAGAFVHGFSTNRGAEPGFGVDASDDVYPVSGERTATKFENGVERAEFGSKKQVTAVAVNEATDEVLVDTGHAIERFGPVTESTPTPAQIFGELSESYGVAVDGANAARTAYASQLAAGDVALFEDLVFPAVTSEPTSGVTETAATLHGTVTPEGQPITECEFEYGTSDSYGESVPCKQTPAEINAQSKGGTAPVQVSAELNSIEVRGTYDFRLSAANANGARSGVNETFYTSGPPAVEGESVVEVGSTEATVGATIDPGGAPTTYRIEYGTANVQELSTAEFSLSASEEPVAVRISLSKLTPATTYRFRLVAANPRGDGTGQEMTFTTIAGQVTATTGESACPNRTFGGFQQALPDCRAYELVSAAEDDTNVPPYEEPGGFATGEVTGERGGRYRAATDGEAVAYMGGPVAAGVGGNGKTGNGNGNDYISVRGPKGWEAIDISPPLNSKYGGYFAGFSPDLSVGFFETNSPEISADPMEPTECAGHNELYSRTANGYHALVKEGNGKGVCFAEPAGISADDQHVLLQSFLALTATAKEGAKYDDENLYDLVEGVLHQVNVLPDGEPESQPDANFGERLGAVANGEPAGHDIDLEDAVSADGSRIFWSSLEGTEGSARPKALYVRENDTQPQSPIGLHGECTVASDACTVLIAEGGEFQAASSDGSDVFYTREGRLFRFDVKTGERRSLSGEGVAVSGAGDLSAATGEGTFTQGSEVVTDVTTSAGSFTVGQQLSSCGNCVAPGTRIVAVSPGTLTLSQPAGESEAGERLHAGSTRVTELTASSGHFIAGELVSGPGIAPETYITEVGTNTLTLSVPVTEAGTGVALAGNGNVQGVIGASEDGSYLYFVGGVVLAGQNDEGRAPAAGQPNLYLAHGGTVTFIATLSPEDNKLHAEYSGSVGIGDWRITPGVRTAEVTPGGKDIAFMSFLPLTGYENQLTYFNTYNEVEHSLIPELFVYQTDSGRLFCASCNPSGAAPTAHTRAVELETVEEETSVANSTSSWFMPRWVNEREGAQVYFMSYQPLVAQDTNGLQDVYEWQSDGSGGCARTSGCISLLSPADPLSNAYFVDASADGSNVFFTSRAQLVPEAYDETLKLYDARADGGSSNPSLACTGTGCQGIPPALPIFATPASVTFNGVGNFEPASPPAKGKPLPKKRAAKCGRRLRRRGRKCVKERRRRRRRAAKRSSMIKRGR